MKKEGVSKKEEDRRRKNIEKREGRRKMQIKKSEGKTKERKKMPKTKKIGRRYKEVSNRRERGTRK